MFTHRTWINYMSFTYFTFVCFHLVNEARASHAASPARKAWEEKRRRLGLLEPARLPLLTIARRELLPSRVLPVVPLAPPLHSSCFLDSVPHFPFPFGFPLPARLKDFGETLRTKVLSFALPPRLSERALPLRRRLANISGVKGRLQR